MRVLISALVWGALLITLPWAQTGDKGKAAERELTKLQGLYGSHLGSFSHADGREVNYQPVVELVKTHRIEGNKWIPVDAAGKPNGDAAVITLDASASPKRIQLTFSRKVGKGKPAEQVRRYGIYEVSEDGLSVHWGPARNTGGTGPAPKQFLERGKPVKGVEGLAVSYQRIKE